MEVQLTSGQKAFAKLAVEVLSEYRGFEKAGKIDFHKKYALKWSGSMAALEDFAALHERA